VVPNFLPETVSLRRLVCLSPTWLTPLLYYVHFFCRTAWKWRYCNCCYLQNYAHSKGAKRTAMSFRGMEIRPLPLCCHIGALIGGESRTDRTGEDEFAELRWWAEFEGTCSSRRHSAGQTTWTHSVLRKTTARCESMRFCFAVYIQCRRLLYVSTWSPVRMGPIVENKR